MKVFRYEIPVDDQVHAHRLSGPVVHVACRERALVEMWALEGVEPPRRRHFRVVGTGQPIPDSPDITHRGTA